ncbi:hypothetical protein [Aeromonas dhakensis]|uniref:hypothetical protein n=1 Tax=Aeromonas dhakensis TaxID=196024 RepID=UPI002378EE1D|nr:hypothetical protein [Aeromonas dhakensis]MDD9211299.1 hypothetical protein [Aeromonas dhakensis]
MNHSFNVKSFLLILSVTITACSVVAESQRSHDFYADHEQFDKKTNSTNTRIDTQSYPIILSGGSVGDLLICSSEPNSFHKSFLLKNETSFVSHYQHKALPSPQEIFNIIKVPESGPEWFSIIISVLALISSFAIPYLQHNKERKEAINEGYWVQEVIMPKINGLAFDVTESFKKAIPLSQDDFISTLKLSLLPKLGELRDSLYLFGSFPSLKNDIDTLEDICDEFEGKMSDNIDQTNETRIYDVSEFHSKLIRKLIEIHRKI